MKTVNNGEYLHKANAIKEMNAMGHVSTLRKAKVKNKKDADPKIDSKINEANDTNEEDDDSFDRGRTWPLVDPADKEEDSFDSDIKEGKKASVTSPIVVPNSTDIVDETLEEGDTVLPDNAINGTVVDSDNGDAALAVNLTIPIKEKHKNDEDVVSKKDKKLDSKANTEDQEDKKATSKDEKQTETLSNDAMGQYLGKIQVMSSCEPSLRSAKGLQCIATSTISSHPAGSLSALLVIFFFCYCSCRTACGRIGSKHWRSRMRYNRRKKRGNDTHGEYAALAVYDELLDSFDNEELSSLYQSGDDDDDNNSMSTILSEWSGNSPKVEMTQIESDLNHFSKND